ncbi:MAG: GTPase [Phycisphaerales bacterium]
MPVSFRISTARSRPAALAIIDLFGDAASQLDAAIDAITGRPTRSGGASLRSLAGVDEGLVVRLQPGRAMLMPHGGPAVLAALTDRLRALGFDEAGEIDATRLYPEAEDTVTAAVLAALARAASPLAVDLLLAQPERWRGAPARTPNARDLRLRRLIDPPLVVCVGPPNVGKSSLLNALARREAAIVADAPGTTRDAVGATIGLAGLTVRWIDTPGRRDASGIERRAIEAAEHLDHQADLLIAVGDAFTEDPGGVAGRPPNLRLATRIDLGRPVWRADLGVSARLGEGLEELVRLVRDRLVPPEDLASPDAWVFDDALA